MFIGVSVRQFWETERPRRETFFLQIIKTVFHDIHSESQQAIARSCVVDTCLAHNNCI